MSTISLPLTPNPAHRLVIASPVGHGFPGVDDVRVTFEPGLDPGGDERCRLRHVLPRVVRIRAEGARLAVFVGDTRVAVIGAGADHDIAVVEHRPLTAFSSRFLADNGVPLEGTPTCDGTAPMTCTDLHTHFAAALSGQELVQLAVAHGVSLTVGEAARMGLHVDGAVVVAELGAEARDRLAAQLDLPVDRQVPFREMQARYRRREPFSKAPSLFVPQLEAIAARAEREGCRYLELSLFDILVPARLAAAHASLPRLRAQHGVDLRFLFALHREDDLEWDLDMLEALRACLDSRAVVGVDFMGHERNSTRAFVPNLLAVAELAPLRPGLVVRVHAGENPAHPENVRVAVETLLPAVRDHGLELRIGHGLYGVDDDLLAEMARWSVHRQGFLDDGPRGRVVLEFNLTSNLALNNIQTPFDVPLRRCVDAGVDVVLGTDGAGLYRTCLTDEGAAARTCGLTPSSLVHLAATEDLLLGRKMREAARLPAWSDFLTPQPPPHRHYTPAFVAAQAAQAATKTAALSTRVGALKAAGVVCVAPPAARREDDAVLPEAVLSFVGARAVLVLSAAWKHALGRWADGDVGRTRVFLTRLLRGLGARPGGTVVVTGGTRHGIEGVVHELVATMRAGGEPVPDVLGVAVRDLEPDELDDRLSALWLCTETLYDKQGPLFAFAQATHAAVLVIGGGPIVLDEVQAAANHGLPCLCVADVPGSSQIVAAVQPSRGVAIGDGKASADAAVARIMTTLAAGRGRGRLRHAGANDAADIVVMRDGPVDGAPQVLLIVRHTDAGAEAGRFALPGGFVKPGELPSAAACRELAEETGLVVDEDALSLVTVVEGGGRDPRDDGERWVRSHLFVTRMPAGRGAVVHGGSDAARAFFVDVDRLPGRLAFDHDDLLHTALEQGRPSR